VWNDTLSSVAQRYAAQCVFDYNNDVEDKLGENIFFTTRQFNVTEAIALWFDQHKNYEYATQTCSKRCRHYTQMVWANSSRVGCASHFCETLNDEKNAVILVCNYSPRYIEGEKPYREGDPCSKCPEETSECIENAC
ncbi:peptidase inhibitor 16-like, partial [Clarias magur]